MNRWNICQMVELQVLDFLTLEKLQPHEPFEIVDRLEHYIDADNGLITLKSEKYEAQFKDEFLRPCMHYFKSAQMLLASRPNHKKELGHLLLFDLGRGYFAVLTPFVIPEKKEN